MNDMPIEGGERRDRVRRATWRRCATVMPCRPASCATNGTRGALLTVLRNGQASTLAVVNKVKAALPKILAGLPAALQVRQLFDQSLFVRAAINGVVREAVMAALPHRHDDPAVSGKLAQHGHRLHFDSAFDSGFADRARA